MVDKKKSKKFTLRFDKTQKRAKLKKHVAKRWRALSEAGWKKILKKFETRFDKSSNSDILNLTPQNAGKRPAGLK